MKKTELDVAGEAEAFVVEGPEWRGALPLPPLAWHGGSAKHASAPHAPMHTFRVADGRV